MATNPITSESLTVDFRSLMKIPVGDRAKAASISPDFLQSILTALTPIQIAKAFPDYYRRQLPDVSNFVTSYIQGRNGGVYNQVGGGQGGYGPGYYDQETKKSGQRPLGAPAPTIEEMKKKLLEKNIDVDGIYKSVGTSGIPADDERVKNLRGMSSDQLAKMGFEQVTDESGKKILKLLPTNVAGLSDEDVIKRANARRLDPTKFMDPMTSGKLRPEIISKYEGKNVPVTIRNNNMGAMSLKDDSNKFVTGMPGYLDKTPRPANEGGYYARYATPEHGVAAASRNLENYGRKGITTPQAIVTTWARDGNQNYINTVVKHLNDAGYKVDQNTTLDLTDPKVRMAILKGKSAFESGAGIPVYTDEVFETGVNYTFESPVDPNKQYTPEEIKELRQKEEQYQLSERQNEATRLLYNQASPTSSEAIPDKSGKTNVNIGPLEDPYEFWAARNPNNAVLEHNGKAIDREYLMTAMMAAKKFEAENPTKRVEMYGPGAGYDVPGSSLGGNRDAGQHLKGNAADWAIYDVDPETGQKLTNKSGAYGNYANKPNHGGVDPEGYALYNEFIQNQELARIYKAKQNEGDYGSWAIRNGMLFSDVEWDAMHSDKGGMVDPRTGISAHASPLGRGSVAEGLSESALRQLGIDPNSDAGQRLMTGVAERFGTGEELMKAAEASYGKKEESVVAEKSTTEVSSTPPSEVPKLALGGNIYGINEDITLVNTATGEPIAQVNDNEKIEKKGNAIQVTPETKLKADELTNKYDSSSEMEDRIANVEDSIQNQAATNQVAQKARAPEKVQTETPYRWRESIAAGERPVSPSFNRAMARTKFFNEGHHFARSAPGSQS